MSQGLQLLSAALTARSRNAMRQLHEDMFTPDERPAYDFVRNFYSRYGDIPTMEACNENGIRLVTALHPVEYYLDRCRKRAVGMRWQADQQLLAAAMNRAEVTESQTILERMV